MLNAGVVRALGELESRVSGLRRTVAGGASLEVALNRVERPESANARLLHEQVWRVTPVVPSPVAVVTAFLDGVQESREVAWVGVTPLVYGRIGAVVRERRERRLHTWGGTAERSDAIYAPWQRLARRDKALFQEFGLETRDVTDEETSDGTGEHPFRQLQAATNAVKQDRERLERDLAERFCTESAGTLYLDGPLPSSDVIGRHDRVFGVIKSHQTVYANGAALSAVLGMQEGERSSVFAVESRHRDPVASWYLRLRDPAGHGPFWGLVRVEVPFAMAERGGRALADEWSGWILAERSPLSLPDGRWDTMAYGIFSCEEVLRAG